MAYPIEKEGVSTRKHVNIGDNVYPTVGEDFIALLVLKEGMDNQPGQELEDGLRLKFEEAISIFRTQLGR